MTTPRRHPIAHAIIDGEEFAISAGDIQLEETWAPYGQATIVAPFDDPTRAATIDPRAGDRATINAAVDGAFTGGDPGGYGPPWTTQRTNLHPNPSFETNTTSWVTSGTALVRSLDWADTGTASCRVVTTGTSPTAGDIRSANLGNFNTFPFGMAPGKTYTVRAVQYTPAAHNGFNTGATSRQRRMMAFISTNGTTYGVQLLGPQGANIAGVQTLSQTFTVPANATGMIFAVGCAGSASDPGFVTYVDSVMIEESGIVQPYFDGSTPDADPLRYEWTGTAHASTSVQQVGTPIPPTPPVWTPADPRVFDLGIRSREIDYAARTCRITLATDEALLQDYAALVTDRTPRTYETSLRALVDHVLGQVIPGAALEPTPSNDADVTAFWDVTNVLANPDGTPETVEPWIAAGNCTVFVAGPFPNPPTAGANVYGIGMQSSAAGLQAIMPHAVAQGPSVTPGRSYVLTGYGRQSELEASRGFRAGFRWLNNGNIPVGPDIEAPPALLTTDGWTRSTVIGVAPVGASRAELFFRVSGATAAGKFTYVDAAMFYEGDEEIPYFDGDTPSTSDYVYSWAGTPANSASLRTPYVDRPPTLFVWEPGVSAWDLLAPLVTGESLRLFCDENRKWRLVPQEYTVPGVVTVGGATATEGADTVNREDSALWATGVVCRYRWQDPTAGTQERVDVAGTPERVHVVDYERPFPGPGAAAYILRSFTARGRVQGVTGFADWASNPGMESRLTLPGSPLIAGRISTARFDLETGLVVVTSKDQTVIPNDSWAGADPAVRWIDVLDAVQWATYTPPTVEVEKP